MTHILDIGDESDRRNVVTALAVNGYKVVERYEIIGKPGGHMPLRQKFTIEYEDKEVRR